jgi:multidrug efflux pump
MILSDLSVKRPVLAAVANLLLIAFGILAFSKLPLREYPDVDPPIVSIQTTYAGAAASVVESRITEIIEDRIAGIEGIKTISSQSQDGRSRITVEFDIARNIDDAANDIRDRVSSILGDLPDEVDPPEVQKANSDDEVILWLNLAGQGMSIMEITDYANRYVVDRFSALDGVSRVQVGGAQEQAMRIWLDRKKLISKGVTVDDVENALRSENVELPAGSIESINNDFTVRIKRAYSTENDFRNLVIKKGESGYLVRLADVAQVEIAATELRGTLRGNGVPMVGIGIIKQSKANTLAVAKLVKAERDKVNQNLPPHMKLADSYDSSVFVEASVKEVYITIGITIFLVLLVIYAFLGDLRATLIPSLAVPVSIIGAFLALYAFGYTINLLTLLAIVLAIGLVVDDAIVVIENIHRRIELGEPTLLAAYRGTRQVAFAVIATTLVLVAVFLPITFLEGDVGRMFTEFSMTMAAAILISGFVALTFSPMLASKLLNKSAGHNKFANYVDEKFENLKDGYLRLLAKSLEAPKVVIIVMVAVLAGSILLFKLIPSEFTPKEDRGVFMLMVRGPEGASYNYTLEYLAEIEQRLMPFTESGEIQRLLMRAPGSFGFTQSYNDARGNVILADWGNRKDINHYINEVKERTKDLTGVRVSATARQALGGGQSKPVQFVIGGATYDELVEWRDIIIKKANENPNLRDVDHDYYETKPQLDIVVDKIKAADLGVSIASINRTLETFLGTRRVTTFIDRGEEYDVILEGAKDLKQSTADISNIYVRSNRGSMIPLSNLISIEEYADVAALNRYNRVRSITIEANLAENYTVGQALNFLEDVVKNDLPEGAIVDYKGQSLKYKESGGSVYLVFVMALVVVFLVLAGQFESFIHPFVIMFSVPLAIVGALLSLYAFGQTLNIYSQIGLIMLIGLATKNGILIVEFINQLRDEGMEFNKAILDAAGKRLRPIIMTSVTAVIGAVPLVLAHGAGAETRFVVGIVIAAGVSISTLLTIFIIPVLYRLVAKNTESPEHQSRMLEKLLKEHEHKI